MFEADVVVVGGGPAGSAAAIGCAAAGLGVVLVERCPFPRPAPGETLHPGVLPVLGRLGVEEEVLSAGFLRHPGHFVSWDGPERFVPFGQDEQGPWLGLQAWRPDFDALLLTRARRLGVAILQPCRPRRVLVVGGRVAGVATSCGLVRAAFVVDATGRRQWLARELGLRQEQSGPRRVAWFGYAEGRSPPRDIAPSLAADAGGWTWVARVRPRLYQWTRLSHDNGRPPGRWLPPDLRGLRPVGAVAGADVTWRVNEAAAGPGYFLVGDAAAVLDPASSHGVLKALMSGLMAAHLIKMVCLRGKPAAVAAAAYRQWVQVWFDSDVQHLAHLYQACAAIPTSHRNVP
jgi:flavin-dependent dehydrogenase